MTMLSEDDRDLVALSDRELGLAWDLWFDLAQSTNDADPAYCHGVFQLARPPDAGARRRMQVRVYRSLADQDRDDPGFWALLSPAERVVQVWRLSEAQWRLRGEFPDASGLPRSVARVRRA